MNELDPLYVVLLTHGLVALRNASRGRDVEYCAHESEYLHEVPSLIGSPNRSRHVYQATGVRASYLKWAADFKRDDVLAFVETFYVPLWRRMDDALGLPPDERVVPAPAT